MKQKVLFKGRFLLSILILVGCATFSSSDNVLPPAPLVDFKPTIKINELWKSRIGKGSGNHYLRLNPVIKDNKIFVADYSGNVVAFDVDSGQIIWQQRLDVSISSGISIDGDKLFIATGEGGIVALNASDGELLWNTLVGSEILATPTATKGIVLAKSIDGSITALSQNDGKQLWHFDQEVPPLILHASSQPQVAGQSAVVGFANGRLVSLALHTGKLLWNKKIAEGKGATVIERMVDIDVSPIVVRGVVYVATYQGKIAALELQSGRILWRHTISSYAGIAADLKNVYISDAKSYVWAFDEETGAVIWRQAQMEGRMLTGPALLNNYIVVADMEGYLHWLSKENGDFVARNELDSSGVIVSPIVAGNRVYVYSRDGYLYAFNIAE